MSAVTTDDLFDRALQVAEVLIARRETVSVAEGSCGGLISAALLSVPGASAYYLGCTVIYTLAASRALLAGAVEIPAGMRGASEPFARWLARSSVARIGSTWGVGEGGASGPSGNPYGDPAGHAWVAVSGPVEDARHVLTGDDDRRRNMHAFAAEALDLLIASIGAAPPVS
jgi:PncC family amidohydrolase